MPSVAEMIKGYGPDFPPLEKLLGVEPDEAELTKLQSPTPALGRYFDNVKFMQDITSGKVVGDIRFRVITDYFVKLGDLLTKYDGKYKDKKVVSNLSEEDKKRIRQIGRTVKEIVQAERIEKFTEHDTAAAGDYVKIRIGTELPHLEPMIEGVQYMLTSEDTMGNVFGIIANKLVYGRFIPALSDFCLAIIDYVNKYEKEKPLPMPGLTHQQAAEPTTLGKKLLNQVKAIDFHIAMMTDYHGRFVPFSGKMGGAIGNLTTQYKAYPDIDWQKFAKDYVEGLGLYYEEMTDQCVTYAVEAHHFATLANMLTHVLKITNDFVSLASCPAQFFVKPKKKGTKGSSIMPNKSNAWQQEGARKMLFEARDNLLLYAKELPNYPHEGDMGRSYMMRNLGTIFMPAFIGIERIKRELTGYVPNLQKISAFFDEYPGMYGSVIQTVLKRERVEGDAYRLVESIAINPDGTYANAKQFEDGLEKVMNDLNLSAELRHELTELCNPANLVGPANELARVNKIMLPSKFKDYKEMAQRLANNCEV